MKGLRNNKFFVIVALVLVLAMSLELVFAESAGTWKKGSKGWWYSYSDGSYAKSEMKTIDGKLYAFNDAGWMLTGWYKSGTDWYYLASSGAAASGWVKSGSKWYYMDKTTYKMQTGWLELGGSKYYLSESGAMVTAWQQIGGKWYYFNSNGAAIKGWLKSGSKWYYLGADYSMQLGWITDGGTKYYLNEDGAMHTGWKLLGEDWYLFATSGAMLTGFIWSSSSEYYLAEDGKMQSGTFTASNGKTYTSAEGGAIDGLDYHRASYSDIVYVDLKMQRLYCYRNNKLVLACGVVTGKDSTPTPTGEYAITNKIPNATLKGDDYESKVNYWMGFIGSSTGFHDALWRSDWEFSDKNRYHNNGSHGCVNMKLSNAKTLYANVYKGMKVIIHS